MRKTGHGMERVLVTGANGFVGAHVACAFFHDGWRVIVGVREKSDCWRLRHLLVPEVGPEFVKIDLLQPQTLADELAACHPDLVIHCAAAGVGRRGYDPTQVLQVNALSMPYLVEAAQAAGAKRFLHLGTCYEYGEVTGRAGEHCPLKPKGLYGGSKAAGALLGRERSKAIHLPWISVRPFSLYGPLDWKHKLIPQLIEACQTGRPMALTNGLQVRDFLFVEDLAAALLEIAKHPDLNDFEQFNLGSGIAVSIRELAAAVVRTIGKPGNFLWGCLDRPAEEVKRIVCDPRRAKQRLGWQPQTTLEEGIRKVLAAEPPEMNRCAI